MLARYDIPATLAFTQPMNPRQEQLRQRLTMLGFDAVRFASLASRGNEPLRAWLADGMHADMHWMERTADKRLDPGLVLPGARSVLMLGVNYWSERLAASEAAPQTKRPRGQGTQGLPENLTGSQRVSPFKEPGGAPVWARYALYEDYHDTIKPALAAAGRVLEELYGAAPDDYRYYVDTGPVLERGWAARAGLGFTGKNAMLISRMYGNWLFLATILTRIEFAPDAPIARKLQTRNPEPRTGTPVGLLCGKCTRCLDTCPTNAFPRPGVVDARRCISYQTIENKGVIPRNLRPGIGNRIYGCDLCLEVCPWNRFAQEGRSMLLSARYDIGGLGLADLLDLTPERFAETFRRTPIKRLKLAGLLRNACIVAGNSGDASLLPQLVRLASAHESPLVRAHAVWAVHRLGGASHLADAQARETDPIVRVEYPQPGEAGPKNSPGSSKSETRSPKH